MGELEGVVSRIHTDGSAQIMVQTNQEGCIPDAEHLELCHCSGCSSKLTIEALNLVGATIGDLVRVRNQPGAVKKNALILLGIPSVGLILGSGISAILYQGMTIPFLAALLIAAAGLLLGIVCAAMVYHRLAMDSRPMISAILKKGLKGPVSLTNLDPVCKMGVNPKTAAASLAYRGVTYYFCRRGCMETFMIDPEKYVASTAALG